ncbi:MAG TPA: sugar ABC transporter ATP-binding protein [Rubrivivax sp.]|nr:sugar ABC transporter ATP-binding protein [Rubrivivax sp.]
MNQPEVTGDEQRPGSMPLLALRDVHKHFRGVAALAGATLEVLPGEVHGLIGQNGAGKSTLIKIVTGVHALDGPGDRGDMHFDGQPVRFAGPGAARSAGISTIYQEVNLVPQRSVAENMFLGREPRRLGLIDWRRVHAEAARVLASFGLAIDERRAVQTLSTAEQQMVALARAVSFNARLVIMDESTSSLDEREVELLFSVVRKLRAEGRSVVFVSHRLDELFALCDRVTVMRDGKTVLVAPTSALSKLELVTAMLGKALAAAQREAASAPVAPPQAPLLQVSGLRAPPRLRHADLALQPGQVLGLAGLLGAGRTELMRAVFAADPVAGGEIRINGQAVQPQSPAQAMALGMAYLSEDRKAEGIFPNLSVRENISIVLLPRLARRGIVDRGRQQQLVQQFIAQLGIKASSAEQPLRELSGGNQQKALLARWIALAPSVLLLDEPTRGIDVGAKADIARLVHQLAAGVMGIVLTSSELEELLALCSGAVVVREGRTVAWLEGPAMTQGAVMAAMAGDVHDGEARLEQDAVA